jgi:putative ABC transport system permease protein
MNSKIKMPVILKIAARNLIEHKTKTLIIGAIVAIGVFVLILGNSILDTATAGIQKNYIENFTGDIILSAESEGGISFFSMEQMMSGDDEAGIIPDYFELADYLESSSLAENWSPVISGMATTTFSANIMMPTQIFGIDIDKYTGMFPDNLEILSGRKLHPGEEGIMLSELSAKLFNEEFGRFPAAGDTIQLTANTNRAGLKIRELPWVGTIKYKNSETNPMLSMICLTDFGSLRAMLGMNLAAETVELTESEQEIMGDFDDADLFSGGLFDTETSTTASAGMLLESLGDRSDVEALYLKDSGEWNFITITLPAGTRSAAAIDSLIKDFEERGWNIQVNNWLDGAGTQARMTYTIKTIFNIIILIIAIVAVIIIMNTLVISITERIPEIGTMRAIGAQKSFVRNMVVCETGMITLIFGLIGIIAASTVITILGTRGIALDNIFLRMLLGGSELHPVIYIKTLLIDLAGVIIVGVAASLYPTAVALRINPVTAMQS